MTQDLSRLPPYARTFLKRNSDVLTHVVVYRFHLWLRAQRLTLGRIRQHHLNEFLAKPFRKITSASTQKSYRLPLLRYLTYLYERKHFPWEPAPRTRIHATARKYITHKRPMPLCAKTFLDQLAVTLKPSSLNHYRTTVIHFHDYLQQNKLPLQELQRKHILVWFGLLKDKGLHPATRLSTIFMLRVYLRCLYELELIMAHPDDLIRRKDLPKLPDYLPRPLPLDIDQALQERWQHSPSIYAKGLLIMRKAGLRIGELQSLSYDCLREDANNNAFLKIPLGKLNNERLVPLSPEIAKLIKLIQQKNPAQREFLIASTPTKKTNRDRLIGQLFQDTKVVASGFSIKSHQLRHSAATELLNAGVSMPSLMKFLGHSDYRMTLRYARITQETLTKEFHIALTKIEKQYLPEIHSDTIQQLQPLTLIANITKWINKNARQHDQRLAALITKRLNKIKREIQKLQNLTAAQT